MAGTADHGEVLTKFEEIFGTLVEHEVIKLVLQGCEWETSKASEILLGMIDENDLPPHILSAVLAGNVIQIPSPKEQGHRLEAGLDTEEVPDDDIPNEHAHNEQEPETNKVNRSAVANLVAEPQSVLSTLSWAPGTVSDEVVRNREKQQSGSPSVRPKTKREKEVESDVSSPSNSPLRINTAQENEGSRIKDTSQWVLAPEFVPNAFSQNNYNGIWPLNVNKNMTAAQSQPVVKEQSPVRNTVSKREIIINKIVNGGKIMVLMRGLPGSGKTTLANVIKGRSGVVLSTDDFFCNDEGVYRYDPHRLPEAHGWNKQRALVKVQEGWSPIVIDNTNVQFWEMKPYIQMALHHGYEVDVLEPETPWKFTPKDLARRNIHGVPKHRISEMKEHYDKEVVILKMITNLKTAQTSGSPARDIGDNNTSKKAKSVKHKHSPKQEEVIKHKRVVEVQQPPQQNKNINGDVEEEDPDVIVEGYEEDEEMSVVQKQENSSPARVITKNVVEEKKGEPKVQPMENGVEENVETLEQEEISIENNINDDGNEDVDMTDEDRIKLLIEEANNDVDNIETDWDDLALQASCEEEVDDSKFNDLVTSFGSAMKQQLERTSQGSGAEMSVPRTLDEEDTAMYEFCNSVEEKLGKSLSTLVRPGSTEENLLLQISQSNEIPPSATQDSQDTSLFSMISMSEIASKATEVKENEFDEEDDASESNGDTEGDIVYLDNAGAVLVSTCQQDKIKIEDKSHGKHVDRNLHLDNDKSGFHAYPADNDIKGLSEFETKGESVEQDRSLSNTLSYESSQTIQTPGSDTTTVGESFASWECVDPQAGMSSVSWESQKGKSSDSDDQFSKPSRNRRKRMAGDPLKWLREEDHSKSDSSGVPEDLSWEPIQGGVSSWDNQEKAVQEPNISERRAARVRDNSSPQPHTGAVPKLRRHQKHTRTASGTSNSSSQSDDQTGRERESPVTMSDSQSLSQTVTYTDNETQTLSIDFEALQLDNNLYELKVIYGQPNYKPHCTGDSFLEPGPLTKGKLRLEKGTMTDEPSDVFVVKPLQNLIAFFPNIPEEDLRDVLQKCKYDLDWAMNVLLDSGYEMSDNVDISTSQDEPLDADVDTESAVETTSTGDGKDDRSSFADCSDFSDILVEERSRRIKQSQDPSALSSKKAIEASFGVSETVDDRVKRLTGKEYNELNTSKVKHAKSKKRHGSKKDKSAKSDTSNETVSESVGAQYITLVIDPLFASQLTSMFGNVGSCVVNGDLSQEDRSVILPLELCHQIHKYWSDTLDGKFTHEAEVLDTLIREDETLARRLQEEEDAGKTSGFDTTPCAFKLDPPTSLQEIMDLEQALQESKDGEAPVGDPSLSSRLNLQRLYAEYPHVDPEALKEEFVSSCYNYRDTVERLCNRYGAEQGAPKTVIAPEAMYRYEQQMILQAQKESLAHEEETKIELEEEDIQPDDPQIYRDEAQMHYHQRQEAFQKAQDASRQGMKAVAAYYARIGNLHAKKFIEANQRASKKILEAVNAKKKDANTLDLHLLHVNEAMSATQAFLKERLRVLTAARGAEQMQVFLITGRGNHSLGGQARLKPAIKDFLRNSGYLFHEANSGMFVVTLRA